MKLTIFLQSGIGAFTITDELFSNLVASFPMWQVVRVASTDELRTQLADTDLLVTWQYKAEWYSQSPKLKAIFTPAAGKDWVARDPERAIPVFHGSFHGAIIAETILGMMLYFNRRFPELIRYQREKKWVRNYLDKSRRLGSQHVVIIGYGAIGRHCARLLKPFGCRVTGVKRSKRDLWLDQNADIIIGIEDLGQALSHADHILTVLPGGAQTEGLLTNAHFRAVKPGAFFYNCGRGNCYAENDLLQALRAGIIAGAGLDVFAQEPLPPDSPLWEEPNVLVMPHASAVCADYLPLYMTELRERLRSFEPA